MCRSKIAVNRTTGLITFVFRFNWPLFGRIWTHLSYEGIRSWRYISRNVALTSKTSINVALDARTRASIKNIFMDVRFIDLAFRLIYVGNHYAFHQQIRVPELRDELLSLMSCAGRGFDALVLSPSL